MAATLSPNEILIDVTYFTLQSIHHSSSSILPVSCVILARHAIIRNQRDGRGSFHSWFRIHMRLTSGVFNHTQRSLKKRHTLSPRPSLNTSTWMGSRCWKRLEERITLATDASGDGITCWLEIGEERFWIGLFSVL